MKNSEAYERLRQTRWRRALDAAEQAELGNLLKDSAELRVDWAMEEALSGALEALPNEPVSSNFTSQVMSAIGREEQSGARTSHPNFWERVVHWRWLPRLAAGCAVLAVGAVSWTQLQTHRHQMVMRNMPMMAELVSVPGPEALRDFEAIQALERAPMADLELLRLLE